MSKGRISEDPQGFRVLMEQFLEWMRVRNYSAKTIANRVVFLNAFINWAEERSLSRPTDVTKAVVERYQRFLYHYRKKKGDPMSFRSHATARRAGLLQLAGRSQSHPVQPSE